MTELVGKPLNFAKAVLLALGKEYTIKENFKRQELQNPILIVTGASEKEGKIELVVGEFYLGE